MPENRERLGGFVLMAGEGRRLRSLFPEMPKPLVPVKGFPMAGHVIYSMGKMGIRKFIANLYGDSRMIQENIFGILPEGAEISWSLEQCLLGTGGGILNALPLMEEMDTVMIRTCDIVIGSDLSGAFRDHETRKSSITLVVSGSGPDSEAGKIWLDSGGEVVFGNDGNQYRQLKPVWFVGAHFVSPNIFRLVEGFLTPPFSIVEVYRLLQKEGVRIRGFEIREGWLDLGTEDGFRQIGKFLESWPEAIHPGAGR
jgi:NDP-sugar pyrophosphorylase family protein